MGERITWWRPALVVAAIGAAVIPTPPTAVERFYSTGVYLVLQPRLTAVANHVPFALFDALLVLGVGAWLLAIGVDFARARRASWLRPLAGIVVRTAAWAAVAYLLFLAV